ncbi:MAG: DUF3429 domain-containing protein [Leptothrix sp. (in: b-proteobacteria)]
MPVSTNTTNTSHTPDTAAAPAHPSAVPSDYALRLGYAGLIPFVLGALLAHLVRDEVYNYVALGMAAYAAVIVSFLGGIHWGLGMRQSAEPDRTYAWGVVPSLVAWIAAVMPAYAGLVIQGLMLIVCYLVDRRRYPAHGVGAWLTLRFRLTVVASLSCLLAAARF